MILKFLSGYRGKAVLIRRRIIARMTFRKVDSVGGKRPAGSFPRDADVTRKPMELFFDTSIYIYISVVIRSVEKEIRE